MNKKTENSISIGIIIIFLAVVTGQLFSGGRGSVSYSNMSDLDRIRYKEGEAACSKEIKVCPDGTSIGRSGSNCEFAPCPSDKIEISSGWTEINHANFWSDSKKFPNLNYRFAAIKFSYPSKWTFSCCNDMDHASSHIVYSSDKYDTSLPYVKIMDYALQGCPATKNKCSIDESIAVSATDRFNSIISDLPENIIVGDKAKIKNLKTEAYVFESTDGGKKKKTYLINTGNDVVDIGFVNHEMLPDGFMDEFLNKIEED